MVIVPKILQNDKLKFCKIKKGTKKPFEKDWTNKTYSYQEIEEYLKINDEQYGVLCGHGDLAVIDSDKEMLQIVIDELLPKTYKVKTSKGFHNYFFIPELKEKIILECDGEHYGEIQSYGTQVVAPNSVHPSGIIYQELNQNEITTISLEELKKTLNPFLKQKETFTEFIDKKENSKIDELSVSEIWGSIGFKKSGSEYYGSHPIHDSTGGMNFWINPLKNTWHCFRCNSGGGVLSAIAVKEGIINCRDAQRGIIRGSLAKQCINIAKEKYGLKQNWEEFKNLDGTYKKVLTNCEKEEIKVIWDNELKNYEEEDKEWIIEKLIPTKSVCVITGKRGTLKTFITLQMAYSIATGCEFLNKFSTRKGKIIYLDKENGVGIMKQRTYMIKKGMEIEDKDIPVGFICFSQLKIDRFSDINFIEKLIEKEKPILLIIDTYRRAISYDENDAGEVSKLFVDTLRPLVEKNDLSIILIHHNRKGSSESADEMDELRGSSDLANYSDIIIKLERNSNTLVLKQLKNRNAQEEPPIKIFNEFGDDYVKLWYEGEFIKKNRSERFAEDIIIWCSTNYIKEFETKQIKELALQKGVKKNNMHNALLDLQSRGIIESISHGRYKYMNIV